MGVHSSCGELNWLTSETKTEESRVEGATCERETDTDTERHKETQRDRDGTVSGRAGVRMVCLGKQSSGRASNQKE